MADREPDYYTADAYGAIGEAERLAVMYGGVPRGQIDPGTQIILDRIAAGDLPKVAPGAAPGYQPPVQGADRLVPPPDDATVVATPVHMTPPGMWS